MSQTAQDAEVFFHGTRAPFGRGGWLFPGDDLGQDNHGLGRSDAVYVTRDLDLAWDYAEAAKGPGAPRVLRVRPYGWLGADDSTVGGEEQDAYRCSMAKVLDVLRERPTGPEEKKAS